ncbi:hypothetical protein PMAYCL1PPCAC_00440, partial [Pristionchus mayeri]
MLVVRVSLVNAHHLEAHSLKLVDVHVVSDSDALDSGTDRALHLIAVLVHLRHRCCRHSHRGHRVAHAGDVRQTLDQLVGAARHVRVADHASPRHVLHVEGRRHRVRHHHPAMGEGADASTGRGSGRGGGDRDESTVAHCRLLMLLLQLVELYLKVLQLLQQLAILVLQLSVVLLYLRVLLLQLLHGRLAESEHPGKLLFRVPPVLLLLLPCSQRLLHLLLLRLLSSDLVLKNSRVREAVAVHDLLLCHLEIGDDRLVADRRHRRRHAHQLVQLRHHFPPAGGVHLRVAAHRHLVEQRRQIVVTILSRRHHRLVVEGEVGADARRGRIEGGCSSRCGPAESGRRRNLVLLGIREDLLLDNGRRLRLLLRLLGPCCGRLAAARLAATGRTSASLGLRRRRRGRLRALITWTALRVRRFALVEAVEDVVGVLAGKKTYTRMPLWFSSGLKQVMAFSM